MVGLKDNVNWRQQLGYVLQVSVRNTTHEVVQYCTAEIILKNVPIGRKAGVVLGKNEKKSGV